MLFENSTYSKNTQKQIPPANQTQIDGVLSKIIGVLSLESQQEIQEKNEKMKTLLEQLQKEIQKRSEEIGYDYNVRGYLDKLIQRDETLEKVFEEIVLGNIMIRNIYEEMIEMAPEKSRKTMKEKLKREYFEDFIFEIKINKRDVQIKILYLAGQDLGVQAHSEIQKLLENTFDGLSLSATNLGIKTGKEIENIMKILPKGLKYLDVKSNDLGNKIGEELNQIMKNIPTGLKSLDLSFNGLGRKTGKELENIIRSLPKGLKDLDISRSKLGGKSGEEIGEIMRYLPVGLKSLSLWGNNLGDKSGEELQAMIKSLPIGLKSLDLGDGIIIRSKTQQDIEEQLQKQFPNINIIF